MEQECFMLHASCSMEILGVRVDNLSKKEILEKIEFFLTEEKFHHIATINPEFILQANRDLEFQNILNTCNLNVADGAGLIYAFMRYGKWLKERMTGVDLMHAVLKVADRKKMSVFLAANAAGLSTWQETKSAFEKKYPNIAFDGANIDPVASCKLQAASYQILLCNFGAPSQEKFIRAAKNDTIRLAVGVGGSFDFATGRISRAPRIMRKMGVEWLWRLMQQPRYRARRIANAVIIFPLRILFHKK